MNKIIAALIVIFPFTAFAQLETERTEFYFQNNFLPNDSASHLLNISGGFSLNSSAITNDFTKGLLFQGFIGEDKKDQVSKKLRGTNRAGFESGGGITYKQLLKNDLILISGIYIRQQLSAKFTDDVFELIFRGNSRFSGQHAQLSPLKVTYFDYQSIMFGLQKNVNEKFTAGAAISLIRGGNFNYVKIDRGTLFTDSAGAYLDFDMNVKVAFTENKSLLSSGGLGAGLNLFLNYKLDKGQINFEMRDLGMIRWRNLPTYEGDSIFRFDGVNVNDVLDFSDSVFTQTKADNIAQDMGLKKTEKSFTWFIPATIHLSYFYNFSEKLDFVAGVKYMLNAAYIPRVYVKGLYYINSGFLISPIIAYGGFGKLDLELAAAKKFGPRFMLGANIFYLEYFLLLRSSSGHGLNLSLTKLF
jgi:hypothetical protein